MDSQNFDFSCSLKLIQNQPKNFGYKRRCLKIMPPSSYLVMCGPLLCPPPRLGIKKGTENKRKWGEWWATVFHPHLLSFTLPPPLQSSPPSFFQSREKKRRGKCGAESPSTNRGPPSYLASWLSWSWTYKEWEMLVFFSQQFWFRSPYVEN